MKTKIPTESRRLEAFEHLKSLYISLTSAIEKDWEPTYEGLCEMRAEVMRVEDILEKDWGMTK